MEYMRRLDYWNSEEVNGDEVKTIRATDSVTVMKLYAKETSIAFAEWLSINGWYLNKIKRWSNRNDNSDNLLDVLSATKSTEELYTLFLTYHKH